MANRPVGYFVHHQGRGHAERAAAIANALVAHRPVTLFCARSDIFPELAANVELVELPSLFEPQGAEAPAMASLPQPAAVHCGPLGWPGITRATAMLAQWFATAKPALFITDVSAELAQFARLCSIPHICVLQHGVRDDPGHRAAYEGSVGLLAPYAERLEQNDRPAWMRGKTFHAAGVGSGPAPLADKAAARSKLGLCATDDIVLVIAGGGGEGTPTAPLTLGARAEPGSLWITIGKVRSEWHETPPGNLRHSGWVDNPGDWIAGADRIVSSCGNTTVHMVAPTAKPWVVVPEWRYFDEQVCKANVLDREGLAAITYHWPSHAAAWGDLWDAARVLGRTGAPQLVDRNAADKAARWIDELAERLWHGTLASRPVLEEVA
jgi:predicted glycosyltransferase